MTDEEKWENCRSVGMALQLLNRATKSVNRGWHRKFRLCSCYLLRDLEAVCPDGRFRQALDVAERNFDGEAALVELKAAIADAQRGYEVHRCDLENPDERAAQSLSLLIEDAPRTSVGAAFTASGGLFNEAKSETALALIREMFGNPFRPVTFSPEWRTNDAVALAQQMYDSRDFGAMPILADALQDAGCDNEPILSHCRDATLTHVRGCWVVDLVLGKA
jgi:hypothetical protein